MEINKIKYSIFVILFGLAMFVYSGIEDSPGGQLVGLLIIILGITGVIKSKKENSN